MRLYFAVQSYTISLHRILPLTCLYLNGLDKINCITYIYNSCGIYKVSRVHIVNSIRHPSYPYIIDLLGYNFKMIHLYVNYIQ